MVSAINDRIKFVDTNILLSHLDQLENEDFFFLSSVTLEELEDIKTNKNKTDDLRYAARKAVRFLDKNENKYDVIIFNSFIGKNYIPDNLIINNDAMIIGCAAYIQYDQKINITFVSDDILARMIAKKCFELDVSDIDDIEQIYKGYKVLEGNSQEINQYMDIMDYSEWSVNEYLIIKNKDDDSIKEMRFDGEKFVPLKLPPSKYIKAKNELQRCALDILLNSDITVAAILGGYGSGKTHLCMQMALYHTVEKGNHSKIVGIREPYGEGREVGYLPGTLDDKVDLFFQPLIQQLHGGEFELNKLKQQGVLESNIPYYLKGMTYDNSILIVDEAEDLTKKQLRLIGTRLGENSKIFLSGDYKQSVIDTSKNNALVEMCNTFKGNKNFGCIYLNEDVRSETSKMFAELFSNK